MKKIIVSQDKCVACGICFYMTDFLEENQEGKAIPVTPGLIDDIQMNDFQSVINECPESAISVVDDNVTEFDGTEKMIKLKDFIENELRGFEVPKPKFDDYKINKEDYNVKISIGQTSEGGFKSESSAESAGMSYFRNAVYSQRATMIQSVIIQYKTKVLKKYAYYEREEGNYYYDVNKKISEKLAEAEAMARAITNNKVNLPSDFSVFDLGPDCGYDGSCCMGIRELEKHLTPGDVDSASEYSCYIRTKGYDTYSYDISRAVSALEKRVIHEVKMGFNSDELKYVINKYIEEFKKLLNSKILLLNNELKSKFDFNISETNIENKIRDEVKKIINDLMKLKLNKEKISHAVSWPSTSEDGYKSRSSCRGAAMNALNEYVDECRELFSNNYGDNIAMFSAQKYSNQFDSIFNKCRKDIQKVYDIYNKPYPNIKLEIHGFGKYRDESMFVTIDIASMEEMSFEKSPQNIFYPLRNTLESKLGGYNEYKSSINHDYNCEVLEMFEDFGFFGKEIYSYTYLIGDALNKVDEKYNMAINKYVEDLYKDEYLNNTFNEMIKLLISEIENKLLK